MASRREERVWLVVSLCLLTALFEGLDIQSMGVAAPRLAPDFALDPGAMGVILSASIFGLMIGAALGGWASDRIGRKAVLALSMLALGVFSLLTIAATGFASMVAIRILAGLGLGGAFPNLIALTADVAPARIRATSLGIVYCGLPLGGAIAGALMSISAPTEWHPVFLAGGVGPLILAPFLIGLLPARPPRQRSTTPPMAANNRFVVGALFGARTRQTLLLWLAYFFTLLAVYLLLNWLPSLMVAKGLDTAASARSAMFLNIGAVIGSLVLGLLSDRCTARPILILTYMGMIASLIGLSLTTGSVSQIAAFVAGFFIIGGQLVLYAIAPAVYPQAIRGTGIGAAVAVGRAGSILGPLLGGLVLAYGFGANAVPAIAGPGLVLALIAMVILVGSMGLKTTASAADQA